MAAPSYTTDLTTYTDCSSVTGFAEATGMTNTDGTGVVDSDLAIYSTVCVSESQRKSGLGSLVYTGTAPTWTSGWAYFVWYKFFAPNSLDTLTNGGIRVLIGSSAANYRGYYVNGSNSYAYGGWVNYAVDPQQTGLANQTQGSPTTTYSTVGIGANLINGISKGNAHTVDIIRYGRGESRFTNGDLANGYATFDGFALVNDNPTTGRWGLLQDVGGSYLWKGLMSLGLTGTAVDFRDSNVSIAIDDTFKVASDFNRIEVHNASSRVDWDTILFTALGTSSRGEFEVINDCDVNITSCTFTGMSTLKFMSSSSIEATTFRRCDQVTQSGSLIDTTLFADSTAAVSLLVDNLNNISFCDFESDGSNHAMELTSAHVSGSFTLSGCTYLGYAITDGSTGNECIYNNSGGPVTININGGDLPTIRNGTGASTVVNNNVLVTFTGLKDNTEVRVYETGTTIEVDGVENAESGSIDDRFWSFSAPAASVVDYRIVNLQYVIQETYGYPIPSTPTSLPIQQQTDRNYENPI